MLFQTLLSLSKLSALAADEEDDSIKDNIEGNTLRYLKFCYMTLNYFFTF